MDKERVQKLIDMLYDSKEDGMAIENIFGRAPVYILDHDDVMEIVEFLREVIGDE
jgi:hypothetical protein